MTPLAACLPPRPSDCRFEHHLNDEELCWTAQIYKHIADPKPGYVADWQELPEWQRETDADIFERIEREVAVAP